MPVTDDLLIAMAGAGGDGVISAGESLITASALAGYHAILTKSFGPQIRGGESSFRLRVAAKDVFAVSGTLDVAIVLNWEDFLRFGAELPVGAGTMMIHESACGPVPEAISLAGVRVVDLVAAPITQLAKEAGSKQDEEHGRTWSAGRVARVCSRSAASRTEPQVREEGASGARSQ